MSYLKEQSYYSDLYDHMTVDRCRLNEQITDDTDLSSVNLEGYTPEQILGTKRMVNNLMNYFYCAQRFEGKKQAIRDWMERDQRQDTLVESAKTPTVRCNSCTFVMDESSRSLDLSRDDEERVMFMMVCPNKCLPNRVFFNTGEEYVSKPAVCEKCGSETTQKTSRKGDTITTMNTCRSCNYITTDTLDLSHEEKKDDPNFEEDRKRFCLSEEEGMKRVFEIDALKRGTAALEEIQEREKQKDVYDVATKIEKLTIKNLEVKLKEVFEKIGYVDLIFGIPEMGKDVFLPFTAYDSAPQSESYTSVQTLKKATKEALMNTNWRLMSDGISYRLGMLTGRLRAYEREEDLLKLSREIIEKGLGNKDKKA